VAADDKSAGAPQGGGGGAAGMLSGLPPWAMYAGGAVLLYVLYRAYKSRSAPDTTGSAVGPVLGLATDPSTGGLIDPLTNLPYATSQPTSTQQTMDTWITSAFGALKNLGYAPALIQKALYDFTNGNPLDAKESAAINAAMGAVGQPPNLLPFFGSIPSGVPAKPTKKPLAGYSWELVNNVWRQVRFGAQGPLVPKPPPKPTTKPTPGYAWTLVNNVWRQVHYASQGALPKVGTSTPVNMLTPNPPGVY
jgi:hypothetical protein